MNLRRWLPMLLGMVLALVSFVPKLAAQAEGIHFSVANNTTVEEEYFSVIVTACSPSGVTSSSGSHSYSGGSDPLILQDGLLGSCNWGLVATAWLVEVNLTLGLNEIQVWASDGSSFFGSGSLAVTLEGDPGPIVDVSTSATAGQSIPGHTAKRAFVVRNERELGVLFQLSVSCSGIVSCGMSQPPEVSVPPYSEKIVEVSYSVSGAVAATGFLTLSATQSDDSQNTDQAAALIQILPNGVVLDRDACLKAALGSNASYECGTLRVTHALPPVRTINTVRAPMLTYNSDHASPRPILSLAATLPSGPTPDYVVTAAVVNGVSHTRTVPGAQFLPSGTARRAVVAVNASGLSTGLYPYTIEVRAFTGGSSVVLASGSGELPVVNRSASVYGAGWWPAGLEQLYSASGNRMMWVGGDGSVKIYEQMSNIGSHLVYMAPRQAYGDTLLKKLSDTSWTRRLPSGGRVTYNKLFRHDSTVNRLGHATVFTYDGSGRLTQIAVPPSTANLAYTFAYTSGYLDSVTVRDSAAATYRTTQITVNGSGLLTHIADPTVPAVSFAYDSLRMISRTDRRNSVTRFQYDAARRIASATIPLGGGDSSHVTYCAGESMGMNGCQSTLIAPADLRTIVDGARQDVPDITTFWLDARGAPVRVQDAIGNNAYVARGDFRFPALPTRLQDVAGRVTSASYDERGNPIAIVDSSHVVGSVRATTRYQWHQYWNLPTIVTSPVGTYRQMNYDAGNGTLLWEQDGRGTTSRTEYSYTSPGLLRTVTKPGGARDSIYYDANRLNVSLVRSAMGKRTEYVTDPIGRVTLTKAFLDATNAMQDSTFYDRLSRVVVQVTYGPALGDVPEQRVRVTSTYDDEGNALSLTRRQIPADNLDSLRTEWLYDVAGRRIREIMPGNVRDSIAYNVAGLPVKRITARRDTIFTHYDTLGRMSRIVASVADDTASFRFGASAVDTLKFNDPNVNPRYNGFVHERDSSAFGYDARGQLTYAANKNAIIQRTYTVFGALESDTVRIRTWARDSLHVYGMHYDYDLAGRVTALWYPDSLVNGTQGKATYTYDGTSGLLNQVRGLQNEQFSLVYNGRNELVQVTMPGNIIEENAYHPDGEIALHRIFNGTPDTLSYRYTNAWFDSTRYTYDLRGKLDSMINKRGLKDFQVVTYGGLGHVRRNVYGLDGQNTLGQAVDAIVDESFAHDALGNIRTAIDAFEVEVAGTPLSQYSGMNWSIYARVNTYQASTGRHTLATRSGTYQNRHEFRYDSAGNTTLSSLQAYVGTPDIGATYYDDRVSYYNALGQLVHAERRQHSRGQQGYWYEGSTLQRALEWYRYDPLGRRIVVRAQTVCEVYTSAKPTNCDIGHYRRTVWAGDQELMEIQRPVGGVGGATSEMEKSDTLPPNLPFRSSSAYVGHFDPNPQYGRVAYVRGLGLDRPLSVTRLGYTGINNNYLSDGVVAWPAFTLVPHWGARGEAQSGAFANGAARNVKVVNGHAHQVGISWPIGALAYNRVSPHPDTLVAFQGTLIYQKVDLVGTSYRRNRYYDSGTGRFTQPDPIGLAGGMNVYGYANGDPINNSDPFGLSADTLTEVSVDHYSSEIPSRGMRDVCVDKSIAGDVQALFSEAIAAGIPVFMNNAYRGGDQLGTGGRPNANPGRSPHRAGFAFDINSSRLSPAQLSEFTTLASARGFAPVAGDPGHYAARRGAAAVYGSHQAGVREAQRSYSAGECVDQQEAATSWP